MIFADYNRNIASEFDNMYNDCMTRGGWPFSTLF